MNGKYRYGNDGVEVVKCGGAEFGIHRDRLVKYKGKCDHAVIPEGTVSIGEFVFADHEEIKTVVIPETVRLIGSNAFDGCTSLESIVLPGETEVLQKYAFHGCTALRSCDLGGVEEIADNVFSGCTSLERVVFSERLRSIGEYAFFNCTALTEAVISEGITELEYGLFCGCSALSQVLVPSTVERIDGRAFKGCEHLERILCTLEVGRYLDDAVREKTFERFLRRFTDGSATLDERTRWAEFISRNAAAVFWMFKDDCEFYRYAARECAIIKDDIDKILGFTDSIECRAILIELKMK